MEKKTPKRRNGTKRTNLACDRCSVAKTRCANPGTGSACNRCMRQEGQCNYPVRTASSSPIAAAWRG